MGYEVRGASNRAICWLAVLAFDLVALGLGLGYVFGPAALEATVILMGTFAVAATVAGAMGEGVEWLDRRESQLAGRKAQAYWDRVQAEEERRRLGGMVLADEPDPDRRESLRRSLGL